MFKVIALSLALMSPVAFGDVTSNDDYLPHSSCKNIAEFAAVVMENKQAGNSKAEVLYEADLDVTTPGDLMLKKIVDIVYDLPIFFDESDKRESIDIVERIAYNACRDTIRKHGKEI